MDIVKLGKQKLGKSCDIEKMQENQGFQGFVNAHYLPTKSPTISEKPHYVDLGEMLGRSWEDDGKSQGERSSL